MGEFFAFFIIILVGLFSSTLLRKLHFPWVIALIIGGIVIGPSGLAVFQPNATSEFIGQLGLTFLMFMAGLETELASFKESNKDLFLLAAINGLIPFVLGTGIGYYLGYSSITMFMIGTVFVSSSIAVVIPTLEINKLFKMRIGKSVMITSILQDIASLILLSIFLQNTNNIANLPLYIFYPLVVCIVILIMIALPKIKDFLARATPKDDLFQGQLRVIFFILIGTVILFELMGLHPIIAAFLSGLVLSDSVTDEVLIGKIRAISYGVFIPTFFILVGVNMEIKAILEAGDSMLILGLIVFGSMFSKLFSGILGAKMVGFNTKQAVFFGASSIPQLSTTLAVSYTATKLGILSPELNIAFVVLSIVSTLIGPIIMSQFSAQDITSGIKERVGTSIHKKILRT